MRLYRLSIAAGILAPLSAAIGAYATTLTITHSEADFAVLLSRFHVGMGVVTTVLLGALALMTLRQNIESLTRYTAWIGFLGSMLAGALGMIDTDITTTAAILHACLSPVIIAAAIVAAYTTAPPRPSADGLPLRGAALLQRTAYLLPPLVLLQIILGASYRHKAMGVLPHMGGALLVSLSALIVCVSILQQNETSSPLTRAASAALTVVLCQISFGIAAFVMRLLDADSGTYFAIDAALHVTFGALTLASVCVLALAFRSGQTQSSTAG